jgi:hypothetical protein
MDSDCHLRRLPSRAQLRWDTLQFPFVYLYLFRAECLFVPGEYKDICLRVHDWECLFVPDPRKLVLILLLLRADLGEEDFRGPWLQWHLLSQHSANSSQLKPCILVNLSWVRGPHTNAAFVVRQDTHKQHVTGFSDGANFAVTYFTSGLYWYLIAQVMVVFRLIARWMADRTCQSVQWIRRLEGERKLPVWHWSLQRLLLVDEGFWIRSILGVGFVRVCFPWGVSQ